MGPREFHRWLGLPKSKRTKRPWTRHGQNRRDYTYNAKAARAPFSVTAIYHDDKFTYIKCTAQEKPTIYEVKDGKPNLINFELANGVYVIPKIVDQGYLALGKKKLSFERAVHSAAP